MYEVTKNPPGASYYMALAPGFLGWSEVSLHVVFLIPALGLVVGIYFLSKYFCADALKAALIALFSPAFLVSCTTLMSDALMLCFGVWAVFFWIRGTRRKSSPLLLLSSVFVALAALTKYFGVSFVLLIMVWTIATNRRIDRSLLFLLIPLALLALYQAATAALYGKGLLSDAAFYATSSAGGYGPMAKFLTGLTFTGGCFIIPVFHLTKFWSTRHAVAGLALFVGTILVLLRIHSLGDVALTDADGTKWGLMVQLGAFAVAGCAVLFLAGNDFLLHRDGDSLLLFFWVAGTFLFSAALNWTVNGRSILPLVPPAAMLVIRRIADRNGGKVPRSAWVPIFPAALLSIAVAFADYSLANTIREDALAIASHPRNPGSALWFQGHWGFQYYMEAAGRALDVERSRLFPGDVVVVPLNNTALFAFPTGNIAPVDSLEHGATTWIATMNHAAGAGFYSDVWGPAPYAFGKISPEKYQVFVVKATSP